MQFECLERVAYKPKIKSIVRVSYGSTIGCFDLSGGMFKINSMHVC